MTHQELWKLFLKDKGLKDLKYSAWDFGDTPDELAELTIKGVKTSTSSALAYYEMEKVELPKEGDYSVVLDSKGEAVCIIKTVKVRIVPFKEIGEEEAINEGDGSLENWQNIHKRFFGDYLKEKGKAFSEDMLLVYEDFELIAKARDYMDETNDQ